jgi:hypothetical protein
MDPSYFPFKIVNKDHLKEGESYYMQVNEKTLKRLKKTRDIFVTKLKGDFVRLETNKTHEYAVFKNVGIMNNHYKQMSCRLMLIKDLETSYLVMSECDSFSDKNKARSINVEREVFLDVESWTFGEQPELNFARQKAYQKLQADTSRLTETFIKKSPRGGKTQKNIKSKRRQKSKSNFFKNQRLTKRRRQKHKY